LLHRLQRIFNGNVALQAATQRTKHWTRKWWQWYAIPEYC
jgi:hypothetical protein